MMSLSETWLAGPAPTCAVSGSKNKTSTSDVCSMSAPINVSRATKMRTSMKFIEVHSDGTATLKYPGWREKRYASAGSALNRRRQIDLGKAKTDEEQAEQRWTQSEIDFVALHWGRIHPSAWPTMLPGRSYVAVKTLAKNRKIKAAPDMRFAPRSSNWSAAELEILTTKPRHVAVLMLAPKRTAKACEHKASTFKPRSNICRNWTPEEIAILYFNERAIARSMLAPKRSARAVGDMALRLRLKQPLTGEPWSATEMALLRNIIRCVDALKSRHGRTGRAIEHRAAKERQTQAFAASATEAVKAACASMEPAVRLEVESEVLIAVLSKAIDFAGIPAEVRAARTRIYGPRHYSLDAPIGDGSMSWIDTIADDREHF